MLCLICGKESEDHGSAFGGADVECPECGRFIVKDEVLEAMSAGYAISISDARDQLRMMRDKDDIPIMDLRNSKLIRLRR